MNYLDEAFASFDSEPDDGMSYIDDAFASFEPEIEGGFLASAKNTIGQTIKGAGRVSADYIPGVDSDNPISRYGQEIVDANPTAVGSLSDAGERPVTAVAEAVGNAAPSMGGMLAARGVGQAITMAAPFTGLAAPFVAGAGQVIAWLGPAAIAALPSYGGIRDKQILNDPANEESAKSKAIAALGAGAVGAIEQKFGPQEWALSALTKEGRSQLAEKFASTTLGGAVLKGAATGAAVEGAEELVQNPIEQVASYDDPATTESLKDTGFGGLMGSIGGGVLGGATGGVFRSKPVAPPPSIMEAGSVDEAVAAMETEVSTPVTGWMNTVPAEEDQGLVDWANQTVEARTYNSDRNLPVLEDSAITPVQDIAPPVESPIIDAPPTETRITPITIRSNRYGYQVTPEEEALLTDIRPSDIGGSVRIATMADGRSAYRVINDKGEILSPWKTFEAPNVGRTEIPGDTQQAGLAGTEQPAGNLDPAPTVADRGGRGVGGRDAADAGQVTGEVPAAMPGPGADLLTRSRQHVAETGDTSMGGMSKALDVDIDTAADLVDQIVYGQNPASQPAKQANNSQQATPIRPDGDVTKAPSNLSQNSSNPEQEQHVSPAKSINKQERAKFTQPVRIPGESARDFLARKREWLNDAAVDEVVSSKVEQTIDKQPAAPLSPSIVTDPAQVQEIRNSIVEGESILNTGEFNGKKRGVPYLNSVRKSVLSSKAKIGDTSETPAVGAHKEQQPTTPATDRTPETPGGLIASGTLPTDEHLSELNLLRKWGDKWQYKMGTTSGWFTANSKEGAVEMAVKAYNKTPKPERLTRQQRFDKASEEQFADYDQRYGGKSVAELKKEYERLGGEVKNLQASSSREFDGNGGRRTSVAVSQEGARNVGEHRLNLGVYIKEREQREADNGLQGKTEEVKATPATLTKPAPKESPAPVAEAPKQEAGRTFTVKGNLKKPATKAQMLAAISEARAQLPEPNPKDGFDGAERIVWPKQRTYSGEKRFELPGEFYLSQQKNSSSWKLRKEGETSGETGRRAKSETHGPMFSELSDAKLWAEYYLLGKAEAQGDPLVFRGEGKEYEYTIPNNAYALDNFEKRVKGGSGVKFSRAVTADQTKNLYVAHNISQNGIRHILSLGGMAAPSLAVSRADGSPFTSYGEVTLLANPDILESSRASVFDADVYSPRYPQATNTINVEKFNALIRWAKDDKHNLNPLDFSRMEDARDHADLMYKDSIRYAWLRDQGKAPRRPKTGDFNLYKAIAEKFRNKKLEAEFEQWAIEKFEDLVDGKRIFKGFTNSGNRRYVPYTLDNIMKEMTASLRGGEGFNYGAGSVRSSFAKKFKGLNDIKKSRDKIISSEEFDKIKEESQDKLVELLDYLRPFYKFDAKSFGYMDDASSAIAEGPRGLREAFNLDAESRGKINEFIDYLKGLPTEYFEAKIQRVVALNEFDVAVVPKGTSDDIVSALKRRGLDVKFYTKGDDANRLEVVRKNSVLFSTSQPIPPAQRADIAAELTSAFGRLRARMLLRRIQIVPTQEEARRIIKGIEAKLSAAFHGSPHDFEQFKMEAIGTGEGAQSFGHGLYFAGSKSVAEWYRKKLSRSGMYTDLNQRMAAITINGKPVLEEFDIESDDAFYELAKNDDNVGAKKHAESRYNRWSVLAQNKEYPFRDYATEKEKAWEGVIQAFYSGGKVSTNDKGRLYEVELAPDEQDYLLWDRPLREQSEKVRAALEKEGYSFGDPTSGTSPYDPMMLNEWVSGRDFYLERADGEGAQAASEYLHSLGIRGIKYLDGSSRGKGDGAHNYVLFSDQDVVIKAKYSKSGAIQGFSHGGQIYMVADGIEKGKALAVAEHEIVHTTRLGISKTRPWNALMRSIESRMGEDSATGEALRAARKLVPANTPAADITEETLSYLVESNANKDLGIVRRFLAMVKRWMLNNLGIGANTFTADDFNALAVSMLRREARGEASPADQKAPMFSTATAAGEAGPMSLGNIEAAAKDMAKAVKKGSITFKKNPKKDSTFLERLLSTPEYYFKKTSAAAGRVLQAALLRRDVRHEKQQEILGGFVKFVQDLRKTNPSAYTEANDYLVEMDQEGGGFRVKEKEGQWFVIGPDKEEVTEHATEAEAVAGMIQAEANQMKDEGYSDAAIETVKMARELTNRAFDVMAADMRRIIEEAKANGRPNPFIGSDKIDEAGRYGVYAAGSKKPLALFPTEAEAAEMLGKVTEIVAYSVVSAKGKVKSFNSMIKAKKWAAKRGGKIESTKRFSNLTVKRRSDSEMRPMTVKEALAQMGDLRGSYFPRIRENGEYVLIARKAGENPFRQSFDLPGVGDNHPMLQKLMRGVSVKGIGIFVPISRKAEDLKAKGYTVTISRDDKPTDDVFDATSLITSLDAILQESMGGVNKNDSNEVKAAQVVDQIITMQIADIFKARGYLASRMKRLAGEETWEGYETDMGKALTQYGKNIAAGTAKRDTARAMVLAFTGRDYSWQDYKTEVENPTWEEYKTIVDERRIDPGKEKNLFKDVRSFIVDVLRNDEQSDRIVGTMKGLAVHKFLGLRISSAAINATNMVTGVVGTMSGTTGESITKSMGRVFRAAVAYGQYRTGKGSAEDRAIFQEITNRGWDEAQFDHEAMSELRSKAGDLWNKYEAVSMFMFSAVEKANRAMTIHAALKAVMAKNPKMGREEQWKMAQEVSNKAHGVYGKETLPAIARGGDLNRMLRLPLTFTKFTHNYMLNMIDMGFNKKEYKAAAYLLLSPAIIAGSGATLATPALIALASALGIGGDDPEEEWYKWAEETFGGGTFARHGLAGLAGINIKGSMAINVPMPSDIAKIKLVDIFGPVGGVVGDVAKGVGSIAKGDTAKGIEALLPTALGSMSKSLREHSEGVTTSNYGSVFYGDEPLKATDTDAFLRFISFNPSRISGIREMQWNEKEVAAKYQARRTEIYSAIKRDHMQGKGISPESLKEIKRYNELVDASGRDDISKITRQKIKIMLKRSNRPNKRERERQQL